MNRLSRLGLAKYYVEFMIQPSPVRECSFLCHNFYNDSIQVKSVMKDTTNIHVYGSLSSLNLLPNYIPNYFVRRQIQDSKPCHKIQSENNFTCWNCNKALNHDSTKLFCNTCNALQPVDKQTDFFNILGIKTSYDLNQSELKQKFHSLQTILHPDKFSSKPKKEQEFSEEFSSIVNKAYSTLLDPLERGLYLLSLNNVSIEEGTTDVDKLFLMEIMERNEEIENESNPQKLNEFYKVNREQLDFLIKKIAKAFEKHDLELAKKLLTEMKYYNTIENKIKEIKQKLNIPG